MIITIGILAAYITLLALIFISLALAGLADSRRAGLQEELFTPPSDQSGDTLTDIGVSVVVCGYHDPKQIEQWLSLDNIRYEIVLVTDLAYDLSSEELLQKYAMMPVDHLATGELPSPDVRGVYESRQRRFRKLVIVDRPHGALWQEYNCGVAICNYDYVLALDAGSMLCRDGLQSMITALYQNSDRSIYAVGGFKVGRLPHSGAGVVEHLVRMIVFTAGRIRLARSLRSIGLRTHVGLGRYTGAAILFDRERIVEAGGFRSDSYPNAELDQRIRRNLKQSNSRAEALFIPRVVAHETATRKKAVRHSEATRIRHPWWVSALLSPVSFSVFFFSTLLALGTSIATGDNMAAQSVGLVVGLLYASMVAVGAIALTASEMTLRRDMGLTDRGLVASLLIYPLATIGNLLKRRN